MNIQDPGKCTTEQLKERLDWFATLKYEGVGLELIRIAQELANRLLLLELAYLEANETPFDNNGGRKINLDAYCLRCSNDLEWLEQRNHTSPGYFRTNRNDQTIDWCSVCWDTRLPIPNDLRKRLERSS